MVLLTAGWGGLGATQSALSSSVICVLEVTLQKTNFPTQATVKYTKLNNLSVSSVRKMNYKLAAKLILSCSKSMLKVKHQALKRQKCVCRSVC